MNNDILSINMSQLGDLVHNMPNNNGFRLINQYNEDGSVDESSYQIERMTMEHIKEHNRRKDKFNVVCLMLRETAQKFCHELEWTHYPPGSERNKLFGCIYYRWNDLIWCVVSIPIAEKELAFQAAAEVSGRLVDGVPTMIGSEDPKASMLGIPVDQFPLNTENTWNLEGR
jgi:hypothetical protein